MFKDNMKKRLLVIEDEKLILEQLLEYLSLVFPEIEVVPAETLSEARRLCQDQRYDLVISDCVLPDGTACEILPGLPFEIPVIILTGHVDENLLQEVQEKYRGPLHLLRKPVPLEKIGALLKGYLGQTA